MNLLEMNMMQSWLVLLPKRAAASSTRLSFCLALMHSLTAAREVLTSPVSASQLPNCLKASLTPNLKFKAGSARRCCMQVFRQASVLISCNFCKRRTKVKAMLCKKGLGMNQMVLFLLLRCMCTVWWQPALQPTYYLVAPAEDTAAQAGRRRVGVQEKKSHCKALLT